MGDSMWLLSGQLEGTSPYCSLRMSVAVYIGHGPQGALDLQNALPKGLLKKLSCRGKKKKVCVFLLGNIFLAL